MHIWCTHNDKLSYLVGWCLLQFANMVVVASFSEKQHKITYTNKLLGQTLCWKPFYNSALVYHQGKSFRSKAIEKAILLVCSALCLLCVRLWICSRIPKYIFVCLLLRRLSWVSDAGNNPVVILTDFSTHKEILRKTIFRKYVRSVLAVSYSCKWSRSRKCPTYCLGSNSNIFLIFKVLNSKIWYMMVIYPCKAQYWKRFLVPQKFDTYIAK